MLTLATFNLCNLGADTSRERLRSLGIIITQELEGPDILAVQEIMAASSGPGQVPADKTYLTLIKAIMDAGGPYYEFREIPPLANQDGGMVGANIRTGLLFNPRRVEFVDRGQATAEDATGICIISGRPALTLSPGRIAPHDPAFAGDARRHWLPSRKALVAELRYHDKVIFCIVCHFKSMRASTRREEDYAKKQRHAQAGIIHCFAANLLACDPQAYVVIMGDMNDVPGSKTLDILKGDLLTNLVDNVPKSLRYTRRHSGRPQALDHVLISPSLRRGAIIRISHINSDSLYQEKASDHDPVLVSVGL